MNLKLHLILRIILIAFICLLATTAYVLQHNNQQSRLETQLITEALAKQLEFQLLRIDAGFGQARQFPDFALWRQTSNTPGICVRYVAATDQQTRSICTGSKYTPILWPNAFANLYRWLYQPGAEITQTISFNGKTYGTLNVASSAETAIANAWENLCQLVGLSGITVLAVCSLVYLSISRALRPAQTITTTLEKMKQGDLNARLPVFEILEWQRTAVAINQLASSQQQLLNERQQLALQLMTVQEEERRYLARELHDELGQCLAAINALATSIKQTASQQCPELVHEAQQISQISQHILDNIRGLLLRLRPLEIDELGLAASLNTLVSDWNQNHHDTSYCRLSLQGDCTKLAKPIPMTVYRITQECLTNIAKHAMATAVQIQLSVSADGLTLTVTDNGSSTQLPIANGMGLLGIRERVNALAGQLSLSINQPHGLVVKCWLPLI